MNSEYDEKTLTKIVKAIIGCISDDQLDHGALCIKLQSGNDWTKVNIMNAKSIKGSEEDTPIETIKVRYTAVDGTYFVIYNDNVVTYNAFTYYPTNNKTDISVSANRACVWPDRFPFEWWVKVANRIELALDPVTPETPWDMPGIVKQIVNHKEHWEPRTEKSSKIDDITLVERYDDMYLYEINPILSTYVGFDLCLTTHMKSFYLKFATNNKGAWRIMIPGTKTNPELPIGVISKDRDTNNLVCYFGYQKYIYAGFPDNTEAVLDEIKDNIEFWCNIINSSKPISAAEAYVKSKLDSGNIADARSLLYGLESVSNYTNTPIVTAQQTGNCDKRILTRILEVIKECIAPSQLNAGDRHLHLGETYTGIDGTWNEFCLIDDHSLFPPYEFFVRYFNDSGKYKVVFKARDCGEKEYISYSTTNGFEMLPTDLWVYPFKEEWWNQLLERLKTAFWTCRESKPNTVSEIAKQFLNLDSFVLPLSRSADISLVNEPCISNRYNRHTGDEDYRYRIIDIAASETSKPSRFYLRFLHNKSSGSWLVTMWAPGQSLLNFLPVCILTPHDNGTFDVKFDYHKQEIDPEKYPSVAKQVLDALRDFIITARDRAYLIDKTWTQRAISKSADKCDLKQDTSNTTAADVPTAKEILDVIDEEIRGEKYLLGYSRDIYSNGINRVVLNISHRDASGYCTLDIAKRSWGDLSIEMRKPNTNSFYPVIVFRTRTNIEFDSSAYKYKLKDIDSKYRHFIKVLYGILCRKYAGKEVYSDGDCGFTLTPPMSEDR